MQARSAARHGRDAARPCALGKRLLEAVDHRPEREPARAKSFDNELLLPLTYERPRERDLPDANQELGTADAFGTNSSQSA